MTDKLLNGSNGAVPSYMAGVGDDAHFGAGMDGEGYPRLAFKGSRFRLRQGGEETVLPNTTLDVIILFDYPAVSRVYYAGAYDPDANMHPSCASADGEVPQSDLANPQANTCAICPQNQKGSSITDDGRKSRACSFYKRLVLLVVGHEDIGPVICDVKAMSLFGDSRPNDNLWTLKSYFRRLASNNCQPFQLVTQLSFDTDSAVPMVLFQALQWVQQVSFDAYVSPAVATPDGRALLSKMADTGGARFTDSPEVGSPVDMLPTGDKPAHLAPPAEPAEEEPAKTEPDPDALAAKRSAAAKKAAATRAANKAKEKAKEEAAKEAGVLDSLDTAGATTVPAKFCSSCGAKWGSCIHTGKLDDALDNVAVAGDPDDKLEQAVQDAVLDAPDEELEKALKDFGF